MTPTRRGKRVVTVYLSEPDFARLDAICKTRDQSKADFLRGALKVHPKIPVIHTPRPLVGVCLVNHQARLRREKRAARRAKKGRR